MGGGTLQRLASRLEDGVKAVLTPGMLFEALGFRYIGPIDGHDVVSLAERLRDLRDLPGPILLHTMTVKGKGFAPAEADQVKWHAQSSPFDKLTGKSLAVPTPAGTKRAQVAGRLRRRRCSSSPARTRASSASRPRCRPARASTR